MSERRKRTRIYNERYEYYNNDEKAYYKSLDDEERHKIATQESEIMYLNNRLIPLRFQILNSGLDPKTCALAIQKLEHLNKMSESSSSEYYKIMNWIEAICRIPFGVYKPLPVNKNSPQEDIREFVKNIKVSMDSKVYGHESAKDHIVRLLAQWISNPESKGLVIGIQGSMGTGKTTLVKDAICKVLGLPFALIPLGGVSDGSFLVGHSYTYEGSTWGRIVDMLMRCECMNPVVFFDELDKVSTTRHGEEIINILIHMTDSTQNENFTDKYFTNIEFDLSRSLIIFSYNNEDNINPILRDRMVKIKTDGYKMADKIVILKKHLIPGILSEFGYKEDQIVFSEAILKQIILKIDEEEGVRNLKRAIHDIISNLNLVRLLESPPPPPPGEGDEKACHIEVTEEHVTKYVNVSKRRNPESFNMMYC